jgi:hypothetical protein
MKIVPFSSHWPRNVYPLIVMQLVLVAEISLPLRYRRPIMIVQPGFLKIAKD